MIYLTELERKRNQENDQRSRFHFTFS